MEESSLHQPTIGPHQDNVNLHQAESGGSQRNNSVVNPQQRGDHEGSVQTTHTLVRVSHEGRAMSPMQRMKETWNVRLTTKRRSCIAHGEGAHHLIQSLPPRRRMMPRTGEDPELRPMNLSLATRNIAISVRLGAQLIRVLGTMP